MYFLFSTQVENLLLKEWIIKSIGSMGKVQVTRIGEINVRLPSGVDLIVDGIGSKNNKTVIFEVGSDPYKMGGKLIPVAEVGEVPVMIVLRDLAERDDIEMLREGIEVIPINSNTLNILGKYAGYIKWLQSRYPSFKIYLVRRSG